MKRRETKKYEKNNEREKISFYLNCSDIIKTYFMTQEKWKTVKNRRKKDEDKRRNQDNKKK